MKLCAYFKHWYLALKLSRMQAGNMLATVEGLNTTPKMADINNKVVKEGKVAFEVPKEEDKINDWRTIKVGRLNSVWLSMKECRNSTTKVRKC